MTSPAPPPPPRRSHRLRERGRSVSTATGGWKIAPLVLVLIAACLIAWSTTRGAESAAPPPAATQLPLGRSDLTCPSVDTAKLKADRTGDGRRMQVGERFPNGRLQSATIIGGVRL